MLVKEPQREELELPFRERERCYGSMIHFIYLRKQLWQNDWQKYKKPGKRIEVWSKIQNGGFFSHARIGNYLESEMFIVGRIALHKLV